MLSLEAARELLRKHQQEHLLAFYEELDATQRAGLLAQIAEIDFGALGRLVRSPAVTRPGHVLPENMGPAPVLPPEPKGPAQSRTYRAARRRGQELISSGKVAAMVVAGGDGTRLGFAGPKGCLPATPVRRKPLFQILAEQILATSARYAAPVPWYVMTSQSNDAATREFFQTHDFLGLPAEEVFFFSQGQMPVASGEGRILLAEKHRLAMSPDGHGGCLTALRDSGALEDMARRGAEHISYFQVDNPLVRCVDPLFIGLHAQAGADMSAKALPKRNPHEKLGNFCSIDGKVSVIEYSDMPEELACATCNDGTLLFGAGSIAIHVFSRRFVERLTADGSTSLPYHCARKKVPHVGPTGALLTPDEPNALKFERFVFDALPLAENVVILETIRCEEFSPIKNATGEDSVATSLRDQVRRAAEWLASAGVHVPLDAEGEVAETIEISPLFALEAEQLAEKLPPGMALEPGAELYLQ